MQTCYFSSFLFKKWLLVFEWKSSLKNHVDLQSCQKIMLGKLEVNVTCGKKNIQFINLQPPYRLSSHPKNSVHPPPGSLPFIMYGLKRRHQGCLLLPLPCICPISQNEFHTKCIRLRLASKRFVSIPIYSQTDADFATKALYYLPLS